MLKHMNRDAHTHWEQICQIVFPALCKKEMGQTIILICAVMVIHAHAHTHTHKHTELTEWHLNMLPWHRACRHGNSMGGRVGYGMYCWDFTLYIFLSFRLFSLTGNSWRVTGRCCCHTQLHTPSCSSAVLGLRDFRQPVFQSAPSYQHPLVLLLKTYNPSMLSCCDAELMLLSGANKPHKHGSAQRSPKK